MSKYEILKLKNGLLVIICNYPSFDSVYFDLAVKVGSRDEVLAKSGIAHLVEHLLHEKSVNSSRKHSWLKDYFNETLTAYTLEDRTNFEFSIHRKDMVLGLRVVAGLFKPFHPSARKVMKNKFIVREEMDEVRAESDYLFERSIKNELFKNNSLSLEILGSKKSLENISLDDVCRFFNTYYIPGNCVLTIAGSVDSRQIVEYLERNISVKTTGEDVLKNGLKEYKYPGDGLYFFNSKVGQSSLSYHNPIYNLDAKENFIWEFFVELLNNYLFYKVAKKLSLYRLGVSLRTYTEFLDFCINANFEKSKAVNVFKELQKGLKSFRKELSVKELNHFKKFKIKNIELDFDYPRNCANVLSWYALMFGEDHVLSLDKQSEIIQSVGLKDMHGCFDKLFGDKKGMCFIDSGLVKRAQRQIELLWGKWKF